MRLLAQGYTLVKWLSRVAGSPSPGPLPLLSAASAGRGIAGPASPGPTGRFLMGGSESTESMEQSLSAFLELRARPVWAEHNLLDPNLRKGRFLRNLHMSPHSNIS